MLKYTTYEHTKKIEERNFKKNTTYLYVATMKDYSLFNNKTIEDLIIEADNQEEKGIRLKNVK